MRFRTNVMCFVYNVSHSFSYLTFQNNLLLTAIHIFTLIFYKCNCFEKKNVAIKTAILYQQTCSLSRDPGLYLHSDAANMNISIYLLFNDMFMHVDLKYIIRHCWD